MRAGTVALIVRYEGEGPELVEALSDDSEITVLERALTEGEGDPLEAVHAHREKVRQEDEEFGDYVEELLSQPFLKPEVQEHGVQWLKSKIKIEKYQRCEQEATRVIAEYAYALYCRDPERLDFFLAGPSARVRIRVFRLASGRPAVPRAA